MFFNLRAGTRLTKSLTSKSRTETGGGRACQSKTVGPRCCLRSALREEIERQDRVLPRKEHFNENLGLLGLGTYDFIIERLRLNRAFRLLRPFS